MKEIWQRITGSEGHTDRKDVAALIVGIGGWEQYTAPLIEGILEHEPDCRLVVIDNDSAEPYPALPCVIRTERLGYCAAINRAVEEAGDADWYLILNNDVTCDGPFIDLLPGDDVVCGPTLLERFGVVFVDAWMVAIPRAVWEQVGPWDENYKMSSYGGIDYSLRAKEAGFEVAAAPLPFTHLETRQRLTLPGFAGQDMQNYHYFREKHGI